MNEPTFGRRQILGLGLVTVAAAVGGGLVVRSARLGDPDEPTRVSEFVGIPASFNHLAGRTQRVAFGIGKNNEVFGPDIDVKIRVSPSSTSFDGPFTNAVGVPGDDALGVRPYYVSSLELPAADDLEVADSVFAQVQFDGETVTMFIDAVDPSRATFSAPGSPMRSVVTPTAADPLGVDPICTRAPECGLHTTSFSDVLGKGRATVLYLGTPALCQSRFCGPTMDSIISVVPEFPQLDFVHCEVFTDLTGATYLDAVGAIGTIGEPVMFAVDTDGTVRSFLAGAWTVDDTRAAVAAVA